MRHTEIWKAAKDHNTLFILTFEFEPKNKIQGCMIVQDNIFDHE